jgi:hypothetical protein
MAGDSTHLSPVTSRIEKANAIFAGLLTYQTNVWYSIARPGKE